MASESLPPAPPLALVIDATEKFSKGSRAHVSDLHRSAAEEIIEDVIHVLGLLQAFAYLDEKESRIDAHAVSAAASMLIEKLRHAQRCLRGEA